jgi:hypothetical protein
MKSKNIEYYPNESKKGIWVICGGIDYEGFMIVKVTKKRPSIKKVKKLVESTLYNDYARVEQWEVE